MTQRRTLQDSPNKWQTVLKHALDVCCCYGVVALDEVDLDGGAERPHSCLGHATGGPTGAIDDVVRQERAERLGESRPVAKEQPRRFSEDSVSVRDDRTMGQFLEPVVVDRFKPVGNDVPTAAHSEEIRVAQGLVTGMITGDLEQDLTCVSRIREPLYIQRLKQRRILEPVSVECVPAGSEGVFLEEDSAWTVVPAPTPQASDRLQRTQCFLLFCVREEGVYRRVGLTAVRR